MITDSLDAIYYRKFENNADDKKVYKFTDYYVTGEKQMEGFSKSKGILLNRTGIFAWYYRNGQKSIQVNYSKNTVKGVKTQWYPNGKILSNRKCSSKSCKIIQVWDSLGVQIASNGNGLCYSLNEWGQIIEKFDIKKGIKSGKCLGFYCDGKLFYEEDYFNGKFLKGISYDSTQTKHEYTINKQSATFLGGGAAEFGQYVASKIVYPKSLEKMGIEGKAIFQFIVLPNGKMSKIKLIKDPGHIEFVQAAYIVFVKAPLWSPAIERGIPIEESFIIPINFVIR
jgi:antitoxin component YwqK of YwqJK toxin-antitoxin module